MLRERLDIPRGTLSACLRWENLGEAAPGIAADPAWRGSEAGRDDDIEAREELRAYGLIDRNGRVTEDFLDALHVVAAPAVEYSCWAQDHDGHYRALVAIRHGRAILLIRNGERVLMRDADVEHAAEELVRPLPDCGPARAAPANVRRGDYDAARDGHRGSDDAQRLHAILRLPRSYAAELHVATRDRSGIRHRAVPRTMIDTVRGRWLITRHPGKEPAEDWLVATPAGNAEIVSALYDMRRQAS